MFVLPFRHASIDPKEISKRDFITCVGGFTNLFYYAQDGKGVSLNEMREKAEGGSREKQKKVKMGREGTETSAAEPTNLPEGSVYPSPVKS